MENIQEHFLEELETNLVLATTGQRFVNYLFDYLLFYGFLFFVGFMWGILSPDTVYILAELNVFLDILITRISYGLFMGLYEAVFKGRTLGKLISGTKAVNVDGTTINFKTAMLRGISRCVPFEAFSAFGTYMWHDEWNDTYVIDVKQSTIIENK
jgi:uncharacterized RDD family membrane protein YckC